MSGVACEMLPEVGRFFLVWKTSDNTSKRLLLLSQLSLQMLNVSVKIFPSRPDEQQAAPGAKVTRVN
jgi:hypothetical protein